MSTEIRVGSVPSSAQFVSPFRCQLRVVELSALFLLCWSRTSLENRSARWAAAASAATPPPHPHPLQHQPCPKNWSDDGRTREGDGQRTYDRCSRMRTAGALTSLADRPLAHRPSSSQPSLSRLSLTVRAALSLCAALISRLWPPRRAATRRSPRATSPRPWTSSARPSRRTPPTPSSIPTEAEHMRRSNSSSRYAGEGERRERTADMQARSAAAAAGCLTAPSSCDRCVSAPLFLVRLWTTPTSVCRSSPSS